MAKKNNRFLVNTLTILKSNNQVISPKTEAGVQKRFTIELAYSSIIFPCLFCYYWLGFNLVSKNITAEHSTWILVTNFSETYGLTIIITEIIIYVYTTDNECAIGVNSAWEYPWKIKILFLFFCKSNTFLSFIVTVVLLLYICYFTLVTLVKEELHQRRTKHFHRIWVMQPEKMGKEQIKQGYMLMPSLTWNYGMACLTKSEMLEHCLYLKRI